MRGPIITSPRHVPFVRAAMAFADGAITRDEYKHLIVLAQLKDRAREASWILGVGYPPPWDTV